jgi:hypothetical protein
MIIQKGEKIIHDSSILTQELINQTKASLGNSRRGNNVEMLLNR